MKYTIDAQGKKIGRVASQAAHILIGKNSVSFAKNEVNEDVVEIINASRVDVTNKKKDSEQFVIYTGFRGGLKKETLGDLIKRRGMNEVFERTISRMIPRNKLHAKRMKKLTIKD